MFEYFKRQFKLIARLNGSAKFFALMEAICFPISALTVIAVGIHSVVVFVNAVASDFRFGFPVPELPGWVSLILVAAAVGYLTNYIAIQMLYYPIAGDDLNCHVGMGNKPADERTRSALWKSKIVLWVTLGFWRKGLIPRNREKVAWQIGLVAEERFVTPEAVVKFLPKISKAFLSKNVNGKVRGIELLRKLVLANRDAAAAIVRDFSVGFVKQGDKSAVRDFVAKIGKSEAVATALTSATLEYAKNHPDKVVSIVREMVFAFTQDLAKARESNEALDCGGSSIFDVVVQTMKDVSAVARGVAAAALEGVSDAVLLPRVENFLKGCDTPERKKTIQNVLESLLPIVFDKLGEKIMSDPKILDVVISGDFIDKLVNVKFDDEAFWEGLGEKIAPRLEAPINDALRGMTKEQFASFFGEDHLVAENVKDTIMRMPLLNFYSMLDDVMAEHMGAIQVFGFVLGGMIGYIQYAVLLAQTGRAIVAYYMIGVPLLLVLVAKIVMKSRLPNLKSSS